MKKSIVVITGSSSGFGYETAMLFNKNNYPLLLLSRNNSKLRQMNLENCLIKDIDVTDFEKVENACREAEEYFQEKIDLLINNAGVLYLGKVENQDIDEWNKMINTNIKGVLNCTKAVLPSMIENKKGTIINVSSICGRKPAPDHTVYSASKTFVDIFTEQTREEVSKHNIRVMLLSPGIAFTNLVTSSTDLESAENLNNWRDSLGADLMKASDIANSLLYMYQLPQSLTIREFVIASTSQDK